MDDDNNVLENEEYKAFQKKKETRSKMATVVVCIGIIISFLVSAGIVISDFMFIYTECVNHTVSIIGVLCSILYAFLSIIVFFALITITSIISFMIDPYTRD